MNAGAIAIILGIIWVVVGFGLLLGIPFIINYEAEQYNEKITFAHSEHLQNLVIQMNFITFENDQHLWMRYVIDSFEKKSGFISVVLPYEGELVSGEGWQSKKFESGSTVIFKNFICTEDSCPLDQGYVTFNFLKPITSFRSPNQYIQIPFSTNPIDNEIINFIRALKSEERHVSFGWSNVDTEVNVIFDNQFDDWESQPTSKIKSFIKQDTKTNIILSWILEEDDSLFTAKYSRELDRAYNTTSQLFLGIGFGSGVTMIALGVALIRNDEELEELRKFVKSQRILQDATTAYTTKDYDLAKRYCDKAIKADPQNIEARILGGNALTKMKRYDDAISYNKEIIDDIEATHITALSNIGANYTYLRNDEKAIEYYEKVLEIDHNYIDALLNMGTSILNLGLPDVAEPYFDEGLDIDEKDELAIANKGRIRLLANEHEEAIKFFDEALQIKPDSWEALQMKGISLLRLNQHEEALACFNLELKINPTDKQALNNKSVALINLGKYEEALSCCDECLITEPNSIETLQNKIHCLEALNRSDDAKIWKKKLENVKNPKTDDK